ncbi:MAG TPA: PIN domain-containing protein [Solirubrobacteraceae bacterium]|nr:PIN domain-containing protein [Solirubrobacteraceae bacterium]
MTLILDTGPIVAALNEQDPDHERCAAMIAASDDLLIPGAVLVEVDYWLIKLGGVRVWTDFVADVTRGVYRVAHPTESDLARAAELESTYHDLDLGLVDASVIALCERLDQTTVATLDRRHFSVVQPRHCSHLTLLPEAT